MNDLTIYSTEGTVLELNQMESIIGGYPCAGPGTNAVIGGFCTVVGLAGVWGMVAGPVGVGSSLACIAYGVYGSFCG